MSGPPYNINPNKAADNGFTPMRSLMGHKKKSKPCDAAKYSKAVKVLEEVILDFKANK